MGQPFLALAGLSFVCADKGWMGNQQVTLLSVNNGTSETERDITFKFDNYLNQIVIHKKKINKRFLEWFIGFTEGKGCFIVLNNKVYFDISVDIKDIQVLYYIKKGLGFGKIKINKDHSSCSDHYYPHSESASFYVTNFSNFYRLVTLFNGNLCTVSKKEEFKTWLKIFNDQYSSTLAEEITVAQDRVIKPSLTNGWLSGYIDALGSFTGRIENSSRMNFRYLPLATGIYRNLSPAFSPTNRRSGKELNSRIPYLTFYIAPPQKEFYILNAISEILNIRSSALKYVKLDSNLGLNITPRSEELLVLSISTLNKLKIIINYLKRYPLKTNKSLAFTKWCKIYNIILNKEHLNEIGLNKIHSLTKEMNKHL